MFATREPNFKRRLAGHLGGLLGASAMLLTVYPTIAAAAPALNKLTLASVCTLPDGDAVMRVGNTNGVDVSFTWDVAKTSLTGKAVAAPGDSYLLVPSSTAGNTRVFVDGKQHAAKKQNVAVCVAHVQVSKLWVDAKGAPIASPSVPKGWALTLRSDLETVTCTWNKKAAALKCASKPDAEDKGNFANVGASLEVPVGGKYMIDESPTPDFDRTGLGGFAVDSPSDLAKFFGGGDTVAVVVTNTAVAPVVSTTSTTLPITSTEAPTTTIESPTTTLAPDETTTTTVEEDTTTTSVDSPTTTLAPSEETTTTVEEDTTTTSVDSPTTTLAPSEETTTTSVEETTTTAVEETTTTAAVEEPTITDEPTTIFAPTTAAPTTTSAPTTAAPTTDAPTTSAAAPTTLPATTVEPVGVRGLSLDAPAATDGQPATQVLAGADESEVLPLTGTASVPVAGLGIGLVAVGMCALLVGRRRLEA